MVRKGSDSVGYRNPPVHTRFPKGTSGNVRGRPKGSQNYLDAFQRMLAKRVTATGPDGRKRTFTTLDAFFLNLRKRALDGDMQAAKIMLELLKVAEIERVAKRPLTIVLTGADAQL